MAGPSGATAKYALPYPLSSDTTNPPRDIQALGQRVEDLMYKAMPVPSSNLNAIANSGNYYATPTDTNVPFAQYCIVQHTVSSDATAAVQTAYSVTGTTNSAYRNMAGGVWQPWVITGTLPGWSSVQGAAYYAATDTGARNAWANLNTTRAIVNMTFSAPVVALVYIGAWITLSPTSLYGMDLRVFPRITKPDGSHWGVSSMPATTNTNYGFSWGQVPWFGIDAGTVTPGSQGIMSSGSYIFYFPAGTSNVEAMVYRNWPSGAAGTQRINYCNLSVTPLRYL